jgi:hypothetical protein
MLAEYLSLYSPIVTAEGGEDSGHAPTPRSTLERVNVLKSHYMELKTDMLAEVAMVDKRIIEPAKDAKASVKQYKKVIKKREDRKLDYERYKSRAEAVEKKSKRSDRENVALAKHKIDLESAITVHQPQFFPLRLIAKYLLDLPGCRRQAESHSSSNDRRHLLNPPLPPELPNHDTEHPSRPTVYHSP